MRLALRLVAPGAELVAVRLPAARRVPLGETVLLRGGERELGALVHVAGRGRVVLARPDWLALTADGLTAVGPVTGPEAVALALPAADRMPPGPLPPRPAGFAGAHRTRRPGEGSELVDVRAFQPGDRLRRVDWRVSARRSPGLQELYVRRTHADADADVLLYIDTRVDVGTEAALWAVPPGRDAAGTPLPGSSLDLAVRAATSLAAAQLRLGDRVGLVDLANRRAWLRPGSGRRQLLALRVRLATTRSNPNAPTVVLRPERLPRGAVVVLFSPLLDDAVADAGRRGGARRRGSAVRRRAAGPDRPRPDRRVRRASPRRGAGGAGGPAGAAGRCRNPRAALGTGGGQRPPCALVRPARRGGAPVTPGGAGSAPGTRPRAELLGNPLRVPRADLDGTGVLVPGLVLRLAVLVAGGLLTVLLVAGRPGGWPVVALAALTAGCAYAPGSVLVGVLGLFTTAIQLGEGALDARAVGTALALYLTWLACALAAAVPAAGRVEVAALLPALRRAMVVAVLTVLVAVAAVGARAGGVRAGEQLLLLVGIVLLAGAVAVAVVLWGHGAPGEAAHPACTCKR